MSFHDLLREVEGQRKETKIKKRQTEADSYPLGGDIKWQGHRQQIPGLQVTAIGCSSGGSDDGIHKGSRDHPTANLHYLSVTPPAREERPNDDK